MSLKRLKPKYILLSTTTQPTQNLSTFTQENSLNFNCKSFDRLPSTIEPVQPMSKHMPTEFKENTANKSFIHVKDDLNDCMQAITVEQKKNVPQIVFRTSSRNSIK